MEQCWLIANWTPRNRQGNVFKMSAIWRQFQCVKSNPGAIFNVEAIWVQIEQGDTKYLVSCIYRPPSATLEYYERIVDMSECARMTEYPVISLGDLNFNYILDETLSTNPIHYIETAYDMHQLIDQPTGVDDKPPLCWMSFLRPIQHYTVRMQFLNIHGVTTISFTLIWNLKILNHQWLITTLWNFVTWKISTWGVSPMI